jgi:hypothetical protein
MFCDGKARVIPDKELIGPGTIFGKLIGPGTIFVRQWQQAGCDACHRHFLTRLTATSSLHPNPIRLSW